MTWKPEDLKHVLQQAPSICFVLNGFDRKMALDALKFLRAFSGANVPDAALESHWNALARRASGTERWDAVSPRHVASGAAAGDIREAHRRAPFFQNIVERRGYTCFSVSGIDYTIDLFNPANELALSYAGAGEPVIALLLGAAAPRVTQVELSENEDFYRILRGLDDILQPTHVCGMHSFASVAFAFEEGRAPADVRPWDSLYPITAVNARESLPPITELQHLFERVEPWTRERLLLQVRRGLDAVIAPEYIDAARALGMIAVQQLVPGAYDRMPRRPKDLFRGRTD